MFYNIIKMLEGLHLDNSYIPLEAINEKLEKLTEEELWDFGTMNAGTISFKKLADKAGLTPHERGMLTGILECAFGECVDQDGKINL